jgi:hypothetical protein
MASWTEKRVERLKLFHKEGFSATLIARKLGPSFTKGMVAGKNPPARANGEANEEGFGSSAESCTRSHCSANQQGSAEEAHPSAGSPDPCLTTNSALVPAAPAHGTDQRSSDLRPSRDALPLATRP